MPRIVDIRNRRFTYQNITVGRANFSYVLTGQAENPAVVLLCGGMNYSRMWHEYVRKQELIATFPKARIEYMKNGHCGPILECEKYCEVIKSLL